MRRRIVILIGTFLTLLLAFGIYRVLSGKIDWRGGVRNIAEQPNISTREPREPLDARGGTGLYIETRDDDGRLESIYIAENWDKQEDGSYLLIRPVVIRYQRNGQRVYICGDRGEFFADQVAGGYNVRTGKLFGSGRNKVKIYIDRATDPKRLPVRISRKNPGIVFAEMEKLHDHKDVIRILVNDVHFDNNRLTLTSDSPVVIWSTQVDMHGQGLDIRWNEKPRELRSLTIKRGQYMAVKNISEDVELLGLPGRRGRRRATTAPSAARGPASPSTPGAAGPDGATGPTKDAPEPTLHPPVLSAPHGPAHPLLPGRAASRPASRPASPPGPTTRSAAAAPADATSRPTPPGFADPPPGVAKNVFCAVFNDSVNVDYGKRYMHHAKTLTLTFEWDRRAQRRRRRSARAKALRKPTGKVTTPAAKPAKPPGPAARPAPSPAPAPSPTGGPAPKPTTAPATKPAPAKREVKDRTLIITWRGPLTLTPIGYTPKPSEERYSVQAEGREIILSDSQTIASCTSFEYRQPGQSGYLRGTKDQPVRLTFVQGHKIVCPQLTFNREKGEARLMGPGHMAAASDRRPRGGAAKKPATGVPDATELRQDKIDWGGYVDVTFKEVEQKDKKPRADGRRRTRQMIREATFQDDVVLTQSKSGNLVRCPRLAVTMALDKSGRPMPKKAVASSNDKQRVYAMQEGSDIRADNIEVTFVERFRKTPAGQRSRVEADEVIAVGNVVVTDKRSEEVTTATADRLESKVGQRAALLIGAPARVIQGQNALAGNRILFDEAGESAVVEGPGAMQFMTQRGLDGMKQAKPRPVHISWVDSMQYYGKLYKAIFEGEVQLRSETDELDCGEMRVFFDKVAPPPRRRAVPVAEPGRLAGTHTRRPLTPAATSNSEVGIHLPTGEPNRVAPRATEPNRPPDGATDSTKPPPPAPAAVSVPAGLLTRPAPTPTDKPTATAPAAKGAAAKGAAGKRRGRRMIRMEQYSRRRIIMVVSRDNVVLRSRRETPKRELQRRLELSARDQLMYDVQGSKIEVTGPGSLVSEDYRPPRKRTPGRGTDPASAMANMERPAQTLFQWKESMKMSQHERRVDLEGDVMMVNRSGDKILLVGGLNIPPMPGKLPAGRITAMTCQNLRAQFGEPEPEKRVKKTVTPTTVRVKDAATKTKKRVRYFDMGPRLGPLDLFNAAGKVNLKDGPRQLIGERLLYDREKDTATIWGNVPGQPTANASLFYEDPGTQQSQSWSSPKIIWHRKDNRIETEQVTGGGG